jgi:diguanylate cyclase (GGDEF)-like protein/PAS domain S-box-containing protein
MPCTTIKPLTEFMSILPPERLDYHLPGFIFYEIIDSVLGRNNERIRQSKSHVLRLILHILCIIYLNREFSAVSGVDSLRKKIFNLSPWWMLPIGLILVLFIAGLLVTQVIRNNTRQAIRSDGESSALVVSIHITSELKKIEGAVQSLAGSPWILPALVSRQSRDIANAESALDRYNSAFGASVSYLMDARGQTIASSNRNAPDSFIGKSYSFRPYFQEAVKGNPGSYFGLGTTSGKRGFYAGFPVKDRQGKIQGVVAMKADVDEMENIFSKYPYCFFISRSGIIFLSSKANLVFKSLWPLDRETSSALLASGQFGNQPFEPIFPKEITDGTDAVLSGNLYLVSRKLIGHEGWSVVLLSPADNINSHTFISIMATAAVCLFVLIFSGIIYFVNRSRQIIRHGEKKLQTITSAVQDAIMMIDHEGNISFWNEAAEKVFGYSARDTIGKHYLELIVPERNREAFEKGFVGFRKTGQGVAIGETMELEALRKDGTEFPAELSLSATQFRDQWIAVGIVRDITQRRQNEEKILALSITDQLTGLHNRRGFLAFAEQQLKLADRNRRRVLLFFADLDGLKDINDTLGHKEGDQAIADVAAVLKDTFRSSDIIARMGGDEFAILAIDPEENNMELIMNRLQAQVDLHNSQAERKYQLSISVGCSFYDPESPSSVDELMASADALMYEQKRKKKSHRA